MWARRIIHVYDLPAIQAVYVLELAEDDHQENHRNRKPYYCREPGNRVATMNARNDDRQNAEQYLTQSAEHHPETTVAGCSPKDYPENTQDRIQAIKSPSGLQLMHFRIIPPAPRISGSPRRRRYINIG